MLLLLLPAAAAGAVLIVSLLPALTHASHHGDFRASELNANCLASGVAS